MRGAKLQGRFNLDYESKSMYEGIAEDIGGTVGVDRHDSDGRPGRPDACHHALENGTRAHRRGGPRLAR
jgi:hypothetical protein